jgi:hypothetical protein
MKKISLLFGFLITAAAVSAQTMIATCAYPQATANACQRKIVRDSVGNIYVAYVDSGAFGKMIRGVWFSCTTGMWSSPADILAGTDPTLTIGRDHRIHLLYRSNDAIPAIHHASNFDFFNWTNDSLISDPLYPCRLPVADVDSSGLLNVFWIQSGGTGESLIYACLNGNSLTTRMTVMTKGVINDLAIANNLQYASDDLFFAVRYSQDSLAFYRSADHLGQSGILYNAIGSRPCITFNSAWIPSQNSVRFQYISSSSKLMEVEAWSPDYNTFSVRTLRNGVSYVCIDDIAPPIGYSYLFMANGILYHSFSYGVQMHFDTIMDVIASSPILPSIAYRTFDFSFVDFIWMQSNGNGYNIYYKRDPKHDWLGMKDRDNEKGFSVTGHPNPFTTQVSVTVTVNKESESPVIQVYNTSSKLIATLTRKNWSGKEFFFTWDGTDQSGALADPGIYLLLVTSGDKRTSRKVIFSGR